MTSMASTTKDFAPYLDAASDTRAKSRPAAPPLPSVWRRVLNSLWASRQRQADMEIARYLSLNGGHLTDNVEREIGRRLSGQDNYRPF